MRWLALIAWLPVWLVAAEPLRLPEVLTSVKERYPPLLIAMIEQDIAAGRLRQADGAFDLGFALRAGITPKGYYDGETTDVGLEQRLPFWGATAPNGTANFALACVSTCSATDRSTASAPSG